LIHLLIARDQPLAKDEFKKFWDMVQDDKTFKLQISKAEMYEGFSNLPGDLETCLENNGFVQMGKSVR